MVGYLTPDDPAPVDYVYRRLRIPNDEQLIANVAGAISVLSHAHNWTPQGTMTIDQAAEIGGEILDEFMLGGNWMALGTVFAFAGATLPPHCLECDGAALLRVDYPQLYSALDPGFIVDADHFVTPNCYGNVIVGSDAGSGTLYPVGLTGGEINHVLSVGELASHTHNDSGHSHLEGTTLPTTIPQGVGVPLPAALGSVGSTGLASANISNTGSDDPHNNMQPYIALRYAIVAE